MKKEFRFYVKSCGGDTCAALQETPIVEETDEFDYLDLYNELDLEICGNFPPRQTCKESICLKQMDYWKVWRANKIK